MRESDCFGVWWGGGGGGVVGQGNFACHKGFGHAGVGEEGIYCLDYGGVETW